MKKDMNADGLEICGTTLCECYIDTEHLEIPDGITAVKAFACLTVHKLKSVSIPSSLTEIEAQAFPPTVELITVAKDNPSYACRRGLLVEKQTGKLVFAGANATLCDNCGIKIIGSYAFARRDDLSELVIPDGVTEIQREAFDCCSNIARVVIPATVRKIHQAAFGNCDSVREFAVHGDNAHYYVKDGCLTERATGTLIRACVGCIVPEGVRTLGMAAFGKGHKALEFPSSMTGGLDKAFCGTAELEKLSVSADNPAYRAADNCIISRATGVLARGCNNSVIPDDGSITAIGDGAFAYSRGLRSVHIPNGVKKIGRFAFESCADLADVRLPDTLVELDMYAFTFCAALKAVILPKSLRKIGQGAFERSALESITIPRGVTEIVEDAFADCGALKEVVFEDASGWSADGVEISPDALRGAAAVRTVTKPQTLEKVGNTQ